MKRALCVVLSIIIFFGVISTANYSYAGTSIKASEVVEYMNGLVGQPNNYKGYCLLFVTKCWENMGFQGSYGWGNAANFAANNTVSTSRDNIPIGADVFFTSPDGNGHIGIHVGDGYFVHAGNGNVYEKNNISDSYYSARYTGWGWHPYVTVILCAEHTWDKGTVTQKATCAQEGVKTYTCTVCGETKTEVIAKEKHNYKKSVVKPTATQLGYTAKKCTKCGNIKSKSDYTAPTGRIGGFKCKARTATAQTVTWNNVATATGYQVQISTKDGKNWTTPVNIKAGVTSYTFKKLAAGNNYRFRVRFYIHTPGKNYFSPWSKTIFSHTLPLSTKLLKIKSNTKDFIVRWKEQTGINGYQIQYSTDANFAKNSVKVTIKKAALSIKKVTGLKAGTKYYVRIRTYKKINGTNYFSDWSSAVTTKTLTTPATWVKPVDYTWSYHNHNLFAISEKNGKYYCYVDSEYPYYGSPDCNHYVYKYTSKTAEPQKIYLGAQGDYYIGSELTDGNGNVYYVKWKYGGNGTVYKISNNGDISTIFTANNLTKITGIYGGNIYYIKEIIESNEIADVHFCKYNIKTKKSVTIKKKAWNLYNNTDTKGRYMLFEYFSQSANGAQITLFDAKTGKFYKITTYGRNSHFSGNKIIYLSGWKDNQTKEKIIRCDLNGKNKKTVYQLRNEYVPLCTSSKCVYYSKYLGGGHNNFDFYAYVFKTKKFVKIEPYSNYIVDIQ